MKQTRRDLALLLPALTALQAAGQDKKLPSTTLRWEDLPVKANGENRSRAGLTGKTHSGFPFDIHQTELAPGLAPHPPHHHEHEEMVMVREGTLEVTISGKTTQIGPGSLAYVASGEEHGWKNISKTRAHYFVIAFGRG